MKPVIGGIVGIALMCGIAMALPSLPEMVYPILGAIGAWGGVILVALVDA